MNARKNARVNMINAVVALFKTNQEAFAFAPALAEDVQDLKLLSAELEISLEKAELDTKDITAAKQALKARILAAAKKMMGIVNAHAAQKEDTQLKTQMTQFGKQLDKAKDSELPLTCSNLVKQIKTVSAEDLAKRGLKDTDIVAFEAQVVQFKGVVPETNSARSKTSTEITKSETLTVKGCAIVNDRIAPTLLNIKDNIPTFYADFIKDSTIRKPASYSTQLRFNVVDAITGEKIEDATINDIGTAADAQNLSTRSISTTTSKTTKTDKPKTTKGTKSPSFQTDLLEIVKEGYQAYQLPTPKLKRGKITTITVPLTSMA